MANWFKSKTEEKLPPELEGKSPEDVVKALKEAEEVKTRLASLETERTNERQLVDTMKTEFESVKSRLAAAEAKNIPAPRPTEELASFVEEPDKAFTQRVGPVANLAVNSAVMTAKMLAQQQLDNQDMSSPLDAKTMDGRLYRAWEGEINTEAKKYPATQMTNPQAWLGIYYLVKGVHADELSNPETRKKKYNFLESGRQGPPPPVEVKKDGVEGLTDEEKRIADKMGVSLENYAKRKASMKFVSA